MVQKQFTKHPMPERGLKAFMAALDTVWKQKEGQAAQEQTRIRHRIEISTGSVQTQAVAAIDPANALIKQELFGQIEKSKLEIVNLEARLNELSTLDESDKERFLTFAFDFIEYMGSRFMDISPENRLRCKQIVFPAGFYLDAQNKVHTPEISELYRLARNKKDAEASLNSLLVRVRGL